MESHLIPTHFQGGKKLSSKKITNTPFSLAFYQSIPSYCRWALGRQNCKVCGCCMLHKHSISRVKKKKKKKPRKGKSTQKQIPKVIKCIKKWKYAFFVYYMCQGEDSVERIGYLKESSPVPEWKRKSSSLETNPLLIYKHGPRTYSIWSMMQGSALKKEKQGGLPPASRSLEMMRQKDM